MELWNYETVVNLIGATRTKTGLRVKAVLDTNEYETGVDVSKEQMAGLRIRRHKKHPDWNYTFHQDRSDHQIVHLIIPVRLSWMLYAANTEETAR